MSKRPLVPGFLKKFDHYLLINKPAAWSARAHLAIWYTLLFAAMLTLLCFIVPFDARESSEVFSWVLFVVIILILGFIGWLIYLLRFNVFKKFGHLPPGYGLMTFFLYATVIGFFMVCGYIPAAVESIRANHIYTNEEIVRDANTVNLDLCRLERDSMLLRWNPDTSILLRYMPVVDTTEDEATVENVRDEEGARRVMDAVVNPASENSRISYFTYKDSSELFEKVASADSLIMPNDTTYVFYDCPDYNFINGFITDEYSEVKQLKSVDIYYKILKSYQIPNRKALKREYDSLVAKYNTDTALEAYTYSKHYRFNRVEYMSHIQDKYRTYVFSRAMGNITDKKYRWRKSVFSDFVRPFYYVVLVVTLLLFIFRHTTIKTFFLSILTAVLLVILTSLAFALLNLHSDDGVFWIMLFYLLLFAVVAFTIGMDRVRRAWKGISLNLFVFFLPYIPLICVAEYYEYLRDKYTRYDHPELFTNKELHLLLAEVGGFVLLLVLLEPVIRPLYRKWYALPEQ